jgi:Fe-S oxidoreductase
MPLPTGDVIGLMVDNLKKRKTVFPISAKNATGWAAELGLPRGGETVIYTGSMYQLLPYILAAVKNLERFEDSFLGKFVFLGRFFNKILNVSAFMARPSRADVEAFGRIIRDIALLLRRAGVEFGYLYEDEMYTGALAYDLGADPQFSAHARRVYDMLKAHQVRSVITVDPHTTNMLRSVYPKVIDGYDLEVKSYLEVLAEHPMQPVHSARGEITIHDSCVYARYEGVIEQPRELLERAGYAIKEPKNSRELTHCCGGPIESTFPKEAHRIGKKRAEQLVSANGDGVATMCPICLATLNKTSNGDVSLHDISSFLAKAYCDATEAAQSSAVS